MNAAILKGKDWPKTKRDRVIADIDHLLSQKHPEAAAQHRIGIGAGYTYQVLTLTSQDKKEQAFLQGLGLRWVSQFPEFEPLFAQLFTTPNPERPALSRRK